MSGLKYLTQQQLNTIRGKASVGHASPKELLSVFSHYDKLEIALDEADAEDYLGTEGWRHFCGLPEDD